MRNEWIKTLILIVLVAMSVLFTTRLWSYPSQFKTLDNAPTPRSVSIDQSYKIFNVIRPYMFLQEKRGAYSGSMHADDVEMAFDIVRTATFDHIKGIKATNDRTRPKPGDHDVYMLVFPGELSKDTLRQIFNFNPDKLISVGAGVKIDRVKLYKSKGTSENDIVVFQDGDKAKFYAMIEEETTIDRLEKTFQTLAQNQMTMAFEHNMLKNKSVYLPTHQVQVAEASYIYRTEDPFKFVEAYFNDPENAVYSDGLYSDAIHQLKKKGPVILYLNPSKDTVENAADPILQSFNFVNGHSGWTDDYYYEGLTYDPKLGESEVVFRMQKGDFPVFSTGYYPYDNAAEIDLKWENGYLHQASRTLLNLDNYDIDFSNTLHTLESGHSVLKHIENQKNIKPIDLEDLRIGYALDPFEKTEKLDLIPMWFYKEHGTWYPFNESVNKDQIQKNLMEGK